MGGNRSECSQNPAVVRTLPWQSASAIAVSKPLSAERLALSNCQTPPPRNISRHLLFHWALEPADHFRIRFIVITLALVLAAILLATARGVAQAGTVTYYYDALGRIAGVTDQNGNSVTYTYDAVGNLISITTGYRRVKVPQAEDLHRFQFQNSVRKVEQLALLSQSTDQASARQRLKIRSRLTEQLER